MLSRSATPCCVIWLLSCVCTARVGAETIAEKLDLLSSPSAWIFPEKVRRCPVHAQITPVAADSGSGVTFAVAANARSASYRFSSLSTGLAPGGLEQFEGLQFDFSVASMGPWRVRLSDGQHNNVRFTYSISRPDGQHSVLIPWASFKGELIKRTGITECTHGAACYSVQPHNLVSLGVLMPYGQASSQLTIHKVRAYTKQDLANPSGGVASSPDTQPLETTKTIAKTAPPSTESEDSQDTQPLQTTKIVAKAASSSAETEDPFERPLSSFEGGTTASHASQQIAAPFAGVLAVGYLLSSSMF